MISIGHKLHTVEISRNEAVIEEDPAILSAWSFGGFALGLPAFVLLASRPQHFEIGSLLALIFVMVYFGFFAVYATVRSTYTVNRQSREFLLQRRILWWKMHKVYQSESIDRFLVEHRQRGSGLAMRMKNGKKKILSMSATFETQPLDRAASALNHCLPRR